MVKRIDKLTPEQEATFPDWVEQWVQWGLSAEQLTEEEWETVEQGARASYRLSGLTEPQFTLRMSSPLGAALAPLYLEALLGQVGGQVGGQVWDQVGDQVRGQVGDQVGGQVWDQVWDQVGGQVLRAFDHGNFEAGFISWLEWFRRVGRLELGGDKSERADAYLAAHTAGPATWFANCFAASDRPAFIHLDRNGALHSDDGAAIGWRDGWSINCWHGTRVPDDFYSWSVERSLSERNSEVRRCAIERIGWENVTERLTLVAECDDPGNAPHKIRLYDLGRGMADLYTEPARILVVQNGSLDKGGARRSFGLPVPASHVDPLAAAADLFGVPVAAYRALERAS